MKDSFLRCRRSSLVRQNLLKRMFAYICLLIISAGAGYSQGNLHTRTSIDWVQGTVDIVFTLDLQTLNEPPLTSRTHADMLIREQLPAALQQAVTPMLLDSYDTVGTLIRSLPYLSSALENLAAQAVPEQTYFSSNLKFYNSEYRFLIYPEILSLLPLHEIPVVTAEKLEWAATSDFTGIVIYMKGDFPVHGERTQEKLNPCLFPKLFDENMDLILSKDMVDPEMVKQWGVFGYSDTLDSVKALSRVGEYPLRIMGTGIFGEQLTDIIISKNASDKILYSEHNRSLLVQGRVLVVYNILKGSEQE